MNVISNEDLAKSLTDIYVSNRFRFSLPPDSFAEEFAQEYVKIYSMILNTLTEDN